MSGTAASPPATTLRSALEAVDVSLLAPEPVEVPLLPPAVRVLAWDEDVEVAVPFRRSALRCAGKRGECHS